MRHLVDSDALATRLEVGGLGDVLEAGLGETSPDRLVFAARVAEEANVLVDRDLEGWRLVVMRRAAGHPAAGLCLVLLAVAQPEGDGRSQHDQIAVICHVKEGPISGALQPMLVFGM